VKRWLVPLAIFALVTLLGVAVGANWAYRVAVHTPVNASAKDIEIEVPPGTTAQSLGSRLHQEGLIRHPLAWKIWLRLDPPARTIKAGRHLVSAAMTLPQLHDALSSTPLSEDEPLTVVEGWRRVDTDAALAQAGWITPGAYLAATENPSLYELPFEVDAATLEGYLFPETYNFVRADFRVESLVQRQLDTFIERFHDPHRAEIEASGRTLHELVTMASMLEREEPMPAVRPKVAGVLYKRLDAGQALGVDATSRYSLESWNDRRAFLGKLRDPDDPYNTRLRVGLPPTPIGAPSLPSLIAALWPESSPYWYYLHDSNQKIHFAKTAKEHEANRRRFNVW